MYGFVMDQVRILADRFSHYVSHLIANVIESMISQYPRFSCEAAHFV